MTTAARAVQNLPFPDRDAAPGEHSAHGPGFFRWRRELAGHRWAQNVPFGQRLAVLRNRLQRLFDRLPDAGSMPRVAVTVPLELDDLAIILPPTEQRLLAHIRARRPLRDLLGTQGFRTVARRDKRVQRLVGRVNAYCGWRVRYQLLQAYERPGHEHHRRPGRPRRLIPPEHFPALRLWVPARFAARHRDLMIRLGNARSPAEKRSARARRRLEESPYPPTATVPGQRHSS